VTGNGPTTRLPHHDTWVHHTPTSPPRPAPDAPPTTPQVLFEPPTRPLHIRRKAARPAMRTRPPRRRIDLPVVLAALVMLALAVGVIVGLATL
jgi:hypothetical protein